MARVTRFKGVMQTTPAIYRELINNGSVTVDGVTYEYDEGMLYITETEEKPVVNSINGKTGDIQFGSTDLTDSDTLLRISDIGTSAGKIPVLSSNGKLDENLLPAVALTDIYEADSEETMLALDAQRGDVCIRTDVNKTFVLRGTPASALSNWIELRTPTGTVLSVNGKTGAVELSSTDLTDGDSLAKTEDITNLQNQIDNLPTGDTADLDLRLTGVEDKLQNLKNLNWNYYYDNYVAVNEDGTIKLTYTVMNGRYDPYDWVNNLGYIMRPSHFSKFIEDGYNSLVNKVNTNTTNLAEIIETINNLPDLSAINTQAIAFAEKERQKSEKNLLDPKDVGGIKITSSGVDYPFIAPYLFFRNFDDVDVTTNTVWFEETTVEGYDSCWRIRGIVSDVYMVWLQVRNLKPNTQYTISYKLVACNAPMCFIGNFIDTTATVGTKYTRTFTTDSDGSFFLTTGISPIYGTPETGGDLVITELQMEEGATATEYIPYCGPIVHTKDLTTALKETIYKPATPLDLPIDGSRVEIPLPDGNVLRNVKYEIIWSPKYYDTNNDTYVLPTPLERHSVVLVRGAGPNYWIERGEGLRTLVYESGYSNTAYFSTDVLPINLELQYDFTLGDYSDVCKLYVGCPLTVTFANATPYVSRTNRMGAAIIEVNKIIE